VNLANLTFGCFKKIYMLGFSTYIFVFLHIINPREVPARRCFGFLIIPGLKERVNMER
jgi:hypothetical protein